MLITAVLVIWGIVPVKGAENHHLNSLETQGGEPTGGDEPLHLGGIWEASGWRQHSTWARRMDRTEEGQADSAAPDHQGLSG